MSKDADAVLATLLTHINNGEYTEAQAALTKAQALRGPKALPASVQPQLQHFQAYIHYRLGKLTDALKTLKALPADVSSQSALKHLEAQTLYKLGRFSEAAGVYGSFASSAEDLSSDPEVLANVLAAHVAAGCPDDALAALARAGAAAALESSSSAQALADGGVTYEVAFNAACALTARGDLSAALERVEQAKMLLRAQLGGAGDDDDDDADKELEAELAVISLQGGYIRHLQGDTTGAHNVYAALAASAAVAASQPVAAAVAASNLLALTRGAAGAPAGAAAGKAFEGVRRLEHALASAGDKLLPAQRAALELNTALLFAQCNKPTECREHLRAAASAASAAGGMPGVGSLAELRCLVDVFLCIREKAYGKAESAAREFVSAHPESVPVRLALVHLPLLRDNYAGALAELEAFLQAPQAIAAAGAGAEAGAAPLRLRPAAVALRVALLGRAGRAVDAAAALDEATAHWEQALSTVPMAQPARRACISSMLHQLRAQSADLKLREGGAGEAVALLEALAARADADGDVEGARAYRVKIVTTCADSDPAKAAAVLRLLPAVAVAAAGLDVDALEAAPAPGAGRAAGAGAPKAGRAMSDDNEGGSEGDDDEAGAAADEDGDAAVEYLPNGKRVLSADKLAALRDRKKRRRVRSYPNGLTAEKSVQLITAGKGPDPHRWLPKWERPQTARKGKGGNLNKGPQGSGISENKTEVSAAEVKANVTVAKDNRPRNKRR
jgi:tetratricopeptide (TPR) repeat protein